MVSHRRLADATSTICPVFAPTTDNSRSSSARIRPRVAHAMSVCNKQNPRPCNGLVLIIILAVVPRSVLADHHLSDPTRKTAHYDMYIEALDPDDTARFVEEAYAHLRNFFGYEPP